MEIRIVKKETTTKAFSTWKLPLRKRQNHQLKVNQSLRKRSKKAEKWSKKKLSKNLPKMTTNLRRSTKISKKRSVLSLTSAKVSKRGQTQCRAALRMKTLLTKMKPR